MRYEMKRRQSFIVTLTLPDGATVADARRYVAEAVASWHGSLEPPHDLESDDGCAGDPMFMLDSRTVTVRPTVIAKRGYIIKCGRKPIPVR
jgi:hypothetical protein